jgi:hypothetical protein
MSYEIVYDKQFIKLPDNNFIPMLHWGSNNCTEMSPMGKERRARDWSVWTYPCGEGKAWATKEEYIKYADDYRAKTIEDNEASNRRYAEQGKPNYCDTYKDSNFGYWSSIAYGSANTRNSSFGQFKGMFTTGCDKALTIEELAKEYIGVEIVSYSYSNEYEKYGKKETRITVESSERFMDLYLNTVEYYKDTNINVYIHFTGAGDDTAKRIRRKYFGKKPKVRKERVEVDHYWTVTVDSRYFVKKLKYGYQYAGYPYLQFKTEAAAKKRIARYDDAKYGVELVNEKTKI